MSTADANRQMGMFGEIGRWKQVTISKNSNEKKKKRNEKGMKKITAIEKKKEILKKRQKSEIENE